MFSLLCHRIDNREVNQAANSKRSAETETMPEEPKAKVQKLELFDEENAVELATDLAEQINNYVRRHVSDKVLKEKIMDNNPIPSNIDKPKKLDMFMKDTLTSYKAFTIARDTQLYNIQASIHKIFGPLTNLWEVAESDKKDLLSENEVPDGVKDKMEEMCLLFTHAIALVGQASNKVSYYRRLNIVDNLTGDSKRAKELLSENEDVFNEKSSNLFGEKFEDLIVKLAKSKKKSKDALTSLTPQKPPATKKPFQRSSLSNAVPNQGGDGGVTTVAASVDGWPEVKHPSKEVSHPPLNLLEIRNCGPISECSPSDKRVVSKGNPSNTIGGKDKVFPAELGKADKRPGLIGDGERVQNSLSGDSYPRFESKFLRLSNESGNEETSPRGGEQHEAKRGNCTRDTITRTVCQPPIFSAKEGPGAETGDKSEKVEQIYPIRTLQDGGVISRKF